MEPETTTAPQSPDYASDIPIDVAHGAYRNISMNSERAGDRERSDYARTLEADHAALSALADTEEKRAQLVVEFARYRAGYRTHFLARLHALARCASPMVTGPARFPVEQNRKRMDSAQRRSEEGTEYRERALKAIRKVLCPNEGPIMAGDANAADRLREEIAKAEATQAQMKAANAAIRKHWKNGPDAVVAALITLGFADAVAREMIQPGRFAGTGFADFQLTNNNANIRRMKARLVQVERMKATPASDTTGANGVRFEDAPQENRVRLYFPDRTSAETHTTLRAAGFRYAPSIKAYSGYRNHNTLATARQFAGAK